MKYADEEVIQALKRDVAPQEVLAQIRQAQSPIDQDYYGAVGGLEYLTGDTSRLELQQFRPMIVAFLHRVRAEVPSLASRIPSHFQ